MGDEEIFHHLINGISRKHPEKKADGSLARARQALIATKAQPLLSVVTLGITAVGGLVTLGGMAALLWYQKQKTGVIKDHIA